MNRKREDFIKGIVAFFLAGIFGFVFLFAILPSIWLGNLYNWTKKPNSQ